MGKQGHKVTSFAKQPKVVAAGIQVKLEDISTDTAFSGWREIDEERIAELKGEFRAGRYGLNIFRNPRLLKECTGLNSMMDPSGKVLVDDGLSTAMALSSLHADWIAAGQPEETQSKTAAADSAGTGTDASHNAPRISDDAVMWDSRVIEVFLNGIIVDFVAYPEDDRDLRIQYNSGIHDEESNKYSETSLVRASGFNIRHICSFVPSCAYTITHARSFKEADSQCYVSNRVVN
jgi:hypothetical protein